MFPSMSHSMANPHDWMQLYQERLSEQAPTMLNNQVVDAAAYDRSSVIATSGTNSSLLNLDGRVSKPARRRPRVSRRTPTTLLSTNTTNFRAMVQQFTGGPCPSGPNTVGAQNFNFSQVGDVNPSVFQAQYQQQFLLPFNNLPQSYNDAFFALKSGQHGTL